MRIDPGVRPAILAALYLTISELGLYEAAAIFGAFPTYVARFIIMTVACFAAFAWLRQPAPSLRNLTVVPYLIRSLLFATTTVLLILAFSTSPSLNHTYTIFMLHIGAAYVIARLPLPLREPLTKGKLWDWPFALAIVVLLIGIYLYHFVAVEPDADPEVAAAGFRATVYAAMAAISFAASNIMATVFEREKVQGVEGRALSSLEVTYLGSIVALIVAPVIAVLLQVPVAPDSIVSVEPTAALAFLFWAVVAATLNLPAQHLADLSVQQDVEPRPRLLNGRSGHGLRDRARPAVARHTRFVPHRDQGHRPCADLGRRCLGDLPRRQAVVAEAIAAPYCCKTCLGFRVMRSGPPNAATRGILRD